MGKVESTVFSHGRLLEGSFIAYICGIEIPIQRVQVHMTVGGQEPVATVELVPDPLITRLGAEDRLEIVAFYLDPFYPATQTPPGPADFRLLFEGEILGWAYTNSPQGRRISITCGNFLRILSDLVPSYLTGPDSVAMSISQPAQGNQMNLATSPLAFPWSIFFYGIDQTAQTLKPGGNLIRRPFDLIKNVLASVITETANQKCGSVISPNFFARYMKRVVFQQRFVPSPLLETDIMKAKPEDAKGVFPILRAVRDDQVISALQRDAIDLGQNAPIWAALQQMFLRMYYETVAITTAPIAQVDQEDGSTENGVVLGPPQFAYDITKQTAKQAAIEAEEKRQQMIEAAAADAYTRTLEQFEAMVSDYPPAVGYAVSAAEQAAAAARVTAAKLNPQAPEIPTKPNCILNYITKPQWIFGVPPTCNVIFPSMFKEVHFEENFWGQPTRMYLSDLTYAELFKADASLVAQMAAMRGGYPQQVQYEINKRFGLNPGGSTIDLSVSGRNFLVWPEEFFRGPRAANVRLPRWFMLLAQYTQSTRSVTDDNLIKAKEEYDRVSVLEGATPDKAVQALIDKGLLPGSVVVKNDGKATLRNMEKILHAQVASESWSQEVLRQSYARYEYYRQRGEQRAGAVIMMFNPYVVPGYPVVLFDDTVSGQNFIAYCTDVRHELSAEGWNTVINFICGQTFDEFFHELFDAQVGNTIFGPMPELASAPAYPIDEVREVIQVLDKAEEYFAALFHRMPAGKKYNGTKTAAFDLTKAINFILPSGEAVSFSATVGSEKVQLEMKKKIDEINKQAAEIDEKVASFDKLLRADMTVSPEEDARIKEQTAVYRANLEKNVIDQCIAARALSPEQALASGVLEKYTAVKPSKDFELMFRDYDNAMRFVSRPICTLEEYIAFRGSRGVHEGYVGPTDPNGKARGGAYYEKILQFKPGPGEPPKFNSDNTLQSPLIADLPDTRIDWEPRLRAYRALVKTKSIAKKNDPEGPTK